MKIERVPPVPYHEMREFLFKLFELCIDTGNQELYEIISPYLIKYGKGIAFEYVKKMTPYIL